MNQQPLHMSQRPLRGENEPPSEIDPQREVRVEMPSLDSGRPQNPESSIPNRQRQSQRTHECYLVVTFIFVAITMMWMWKELREMNTTFTQRFDTMDQKFERIDEKFVRIDENFDRINNEFIKVHSAITGLRNTIVNEAIGVTKAYTDIDSVINSSLKIVNTYLNSANQNKTRNSTGSLTVHEDGQIYVLTAAHAIRTTKTEMVSIRSLTALLGNCSKSDLRNATKFSDLVSRYTANKQANSSLQDLADVLVKANLSYAMNVEQRTNHTTIKTGAKDQNICITWFAYRLPEFESFVPHLQVNMSQTADIVIFEDDKIDLAKVRVTVVDKNTGNTLNASDLGLLSLSKTPLRITQNLFGVGFMNNITQVPTRLSGTVDHIKDGYKCRHVADTHGVGGYSGAALHTLGKIVAVHQGGGITDHSSGEEQENEDSSTAQIHKNLTMKAFIGAVEAINKAPGQISTSDAAISSLSYELGVTINDAARNPTSVIEDVSCFETMRWYSAQRDKELPTN